jgi:hypothetical protein
MHDLALLEYNKHHKFNIKLYGIPSPATMVHFSAFAFSLASQITFSVVTSLKWYP